MQDILILETCLVCVWNHVEPPTPNPTWWNLLVISVKSYLWWKISWYGYDKLVYCLPQDCHFAIDHVRQMVTKPIIKVIVILRQRKEQHVPPSLPQTPAPSPPPDMHTCQVLKFSSPLSTTED